LLQGVSLRRRGSLLAEEEISREAKTFGARFVIEKIGPFGTKRWIFSKSAARGRSGKRLPLDSRYRQ